MILRRVLGAPALRRQPAPRPTVKARSSAGPVSSARRTTSSNPAMARTATAAAATPTGEPRPVWSRASNVETTSQAAAMNGSSLSAKPATKLSAPKMNGRRGGARAPSTPQATSDVVMRYPIGM